MKCRTRSTVWALLLFALLAFPATSSEADPLMAHGPCKASIQDLINTHQNDTAFRQLLDDAFADMRQLPQGYPGVNPWIGKRFPDLVAFLTDWCAFLPTMVNGEDNGLKFIKDFAWFYYQNKAGMRFVKHSPGKEIMQDFAKQHGAYLDSGASKKYVAQWLQDPRAEREDYNLPDPKAKDGGFKSFNQFFARTLKNQNKSRPQTMPDRDYVISAPTDCIMNSVNQRIVDSETRLPTKFRQALNINDMLGGSKYAKRFVGGTALSCVLMPNTYHHYHSPVAGHVVEAGIIKDAYYGYDNFPKWVPPNGNVGYYGTEFSQFERFQRGYFVVDTGKYVHVAMVPVGLDTISSIIFNKRFREIERPVPVKRGDELGHFLYGGSLFIMIFEPGRYKSDAIKVRLGNQIGVFDPGK
ncbi:MAG: phosphatidylserine decarboxylase [Magnetococcales bacterium]|nr:phosphatidylserine decarboxylase [Magnetococcales bacterium]